MFDFPALAKMSAEHLAGLDAAVLVQQCGSYFLHYILSQLTHTAETGADAIKAQLWETSTAAAKTRQAVGHIEN